MSPCPQPTPAPWALPKSPFSMEKPPGNATGHPNPAQHPGRIPSQGIWDPKNPFWNIPTQHSPFSTCHRAPQGRVCSQNLNFPWKNHLGMLQDTQTWPGCSQNLNFPRKNHLGMLQDTQPLLSIPGKSNPEGFGILKIHLQTHSHQKLPLASPQESRAGPPASQKSPFPWQRAAAEPWNSMEFPGILPESQTTPRASTGIPPPPPTPGISAPNPGDFPIPRGMRKEPPGLGPPPAQRGVGNVGIVPKSRDSAAAGAHLDRLRLTLLLPKISRKNIPGHSRASGGRTALPRLLLAPTGRDWEQLGGKNGRDWEKNWDKVGETGKKLG
ncbi:leucine-rich repeat extensin-like protein 5 [Passer montanus]|uniref:leucine-rich repeat extensin-like protein 5 n=1 Tax=Passer montanus TaxID=9160 RepID=UPI001961182D|nr:leucine-rich repeat extensin-like protein 5 [Passer montanus]